MQYAELFQDVKVLGNSRKLISQTYTVMGADAFNNQQWDKAIEIFSKGYEANPTDTDLALFLAESYAASGDYENGMKIYKDIVELESASQPLQGTGRCRTGEDGLLSDAACRRGRRGGQCGRSV